MKLSHRLSLILAVSALAYAVSAQANEHNDPTGPLTLIHATPLSEIVGDFDHFAVDSRRNHLFVSAEVHHSIEMFDLRTGEHIQSI
jgi:hypothetical protein